MIKTIERDHSYNLDELLTYLMREKKQRLELHLANIDSNPERAKREMKMCIHYDRMYEAAKFYRKN